MSWCRPVAGRWNCPRGCRIGRSSHRYPGAGFWRARKIRAGCGNPYSRAVSFRPCPRRLAFRAAPPAATRNSCRCRSSRSGLVARMRRAPASIVVAKRRRVSDESVIAAALSLPVRRWANASMTFRVAATVSRALAVRAAATRRSRPSSGRALRCRNGHWSRPASASVTSCPALSIMDRRWSNEAGAALLASRSRSRAAVRCARTSVAAAAAWTPMISAKRTSKTPAIPIRQRRHPCRPPCALPRRRAIGYSYRRMPVAWRRLRATKRPAIEMATTASRTSTAITTPDRPPPSVSAADTPLRPTVTGIVAST